MSAALECPAVKKKPPQRESIGEAFRRLREQFGLTLEEVAERLAESVPDMWRLAKALGAVIRDDRNRRGMTIERFSEAIGVDVKMLQVVEAGHTIDFDARVFCRIAAALRRTPDELVTMTHIRERRMTVQ